MHSKIINSIFDIISKGKEKGIGQLYTEDEFYDTTTITFGNKSHVNFGSYGYLGLEHDVRLKNAAIDAIKRYGIQYSSSRTYVSTTLYIELEEKLEEIFNNPIALATTTTLAHIAAMPIIIEEGDVIIMDQQVHSSVQFMVSHIKQYGIPFFIVRHNRMDQLEQKIIELSNNFKRVWYMCDGVYSMYGDTAPMEQLEILLNRYKKFNIYVDDAHGMSWAGENGSGYALSKIKLHKRMVLITSMNKAFAAGGAIIVLKDEQKINKIKTCGGPLIFAGQHQMSSLGAALACAKIHLSPEINLMQNDLIEKVQYCHDLLLKSELPVISEGVTPIFFVGVGLPKVGYNLIKKMMDCGFYMNLAVFPAVAETCTGVRFTIIKSHTFEQIFQMVAKLKGCFFESLKEEKRVLKDIYRAFRKVKKFDLTSQMDSNRSMEGQFKIQHERSINNISEKLWNSLLGNHSVFDWRGLLNLETIFKKNQRHNNWDFHYLIIYDKNDIPVFATYMTACLTKDDAFAAPSISLEIEEEREKDIYYLCSKTLMMGCPISSGKHYYLKMDERWPSILNLFLKFLDENEEQFKTTNLNLRDFDSSNQELSNYFSDHGFIKVDMPTNYIVSKQIPILNLEVYLAGLKSSQRRYIKNKAILNEKNFETIEIQELSHGVLDRLFELYQNVKSRSFELNLFEFPRKILKMAILDSSWDVIGMASIKDPSKIVGMSCSYVHNQQYHFLLVGLDYDYVIEEGVYTQLLWQIVKRSEKLNCKLINFGMTTGQNKRKFGASEIKTCSFIQLKDNLNASIIQQMSQENGLTKKLKELRSYSSEVIKS